VGEDRIIGIITACGVARIQIHYSSGFDIVSKMFQPLSENIQWLWNHRKARVDVLIAETQCSHVQTAG
jgi:hypothetical protein